MALEQALVLVVERNLVVDLEVVPFGLAIRLEVLVDTESLEGSVTKKQIELDTRMKQSKLRVDMMKK